MQKLANYLLVLSLIVLCQTSDPLPYSVQLLQREIVKNIKMDFTHYKLYPFALTKLQQFRLQYQSIESIKAEVKVHWIDNQKGQLTYPNYSKEEYIRARIIQLSTNITIQQRKFHFETGLNFMAQGKKKYALIFDNFGEKNKMVELAISKIQPAGVSQLAQQECANKTSSALAIGEEIYSELSRLIGERERKNHYQKQIYKQIESSLQYYLFSSIWQVGVVAFLMIVQFLLFKRLLKSDWSFV